jgi:hypothetical protein
MQAGGAMYGVLLAGESRVVALAQPRAQPLAAADLLLLASFVTGADSFRAAPESCAPLCLPAYNPSAFLHAYVHYLDPVRLIGKKRRTLELPGPLLPVVLAVEKHGWCMCFVFCVHIAGSPELAMSVLLLQRWRSHFQHLTQAKHPKKEPELPLSM